MEKQYKVIGITLNLGGIIYPENSVISLDGEPDSFLSNYLVEIPPNSDSVIFDEPLNQIEVLSVPDSVNNDLPDPSGPVKRKYKTKFKGKK